MQRLGRQGEGERAVECLGGVLPVQGHAGSSVEFGGDAVQLVDLSPTDPALQRTGYVAAEELDRYPRTASGQQARTSGIAAGRLDMSTWNLQASAVPLRWSWFALL